ncbi:MAG: hypothetical protein JST21_00515 [Bacteroidetes bacterium]|nr:hypothetical protein [Bacteroidota bacterium]MBS1920791.1 hypothetical protein [Bacteroidota bacterium]MBS1930230.1 hypothetical protein [Bacteroidota bacterium]
MDAIKIPKHFPVVLNQVFEIENKLKNITEANSIQRNLERIKDYFENEALQDGQGIVYHNPIGEPYNVTRADCEATISGTDHENLVIIEVLKPILYFKYANTQMIIQKAIVIVQSQNLK